MQAPFGRASKIIPARYFVERAVPKTGPRFGASSFFFVDFGARSPSFSGVAASASAEINASPAGTSGFAASARADGSLNVAFPAPVFGGSAAFGSTSNASADKSAWTSGSSIFGFVVFLSTSRALPKLNCAAAGAAESAKITPTTQAAQKLKTLFFVIFSHPRFRERTVSFSIILL
ncbi:MAG: hypothetical protein HUJ65_06570 [Oscillospiraceae bacterium]|nr:hypothetical protein [Oscillospiraceae bacterium]